MQTQGIRSTLDTVTLPLGSGCVPSLIDTKEGLVLGIDIAIGRVDVFGLFFALAVLVSKAGNNTGGIACDALEAVTNRRHDPTTEDIIDASIFGLGQHAYLFEYFYRQAMRLRKLIEGAFGIGVTDTLVAYIII